MSSPSDSDPVKLHYEKVPLSLLWLFLDICNLIAPKPRPTNFKEGVWSVNDLALRFPERLKALRKEGTESKSYESQLEEEVTSANSGKQQRRKEGSTQSRDERILGLRLKDLDGILDGDDTDTVQTEPNQDATASAKTNRRKTNGLSLFAKNSRGNIIGLTSWGSELREVVEKLQAANATYRNRGQALHVSVAEAAATYILPEILWERDRAVDLATGPKPLPVRMDRSDLLFLRPSGEVVTGYLDGAIIWDPDLRSDQVVIDRSLQREDIDNSRVPICLLFHASHAFAKWLNHALPPSDGGELRQAIREHALHYPAQLTGLLELAENLVGVDKCFRAEGFPAVVAHVRTGAALGLFPQWDAVLDRLRVEDHIYHLPLPDDIGPPKVGLVAYYRRESGSRTEEMRRLVGELREAFRTARDPEPSTLWTPVSWDEPFGKPDAKGLFSEMRVHYINRSSGKRPYPKWRTGKWTFGVTGASGPAGGVVVEGTYTMVHGVLNKAVPFTLSGELTDHSLHIVSTPQPLKEPQSEEERNWNEELPKLRPSTLNFVRILERRAAGDPVRVVFGFIHTVRDQITTVAPFLLCPGHVTLGVKELRAICGLVEFHTRATKLDLSLAD